MGQYSDLTGWSNPCEASSTEPGVLQVLDLLLWVSTRQSGGDPGSSESLWEDWGTVPLIHCFLHVAQWLAKKRQFHKSSWESKSRWCSQLNGNCSGREKGSKWLNLMMQEEWSWEESYKWSGKGEAKVRDFKSAVEIMIQDLTWQVDVLGWETETTKNVLMGLKTLNNVHVFWLVHNCW